MAILDLLKSGIDSGFEKIVARRLSLSPFYSHGE